mmetsp:Transcript_16757/g.20148  ORF Transcript_16757/g.20148 Transcript_16757/m.20148 type:complete len:545 (+) Transcript_16757:269-1903(+)|eukprot:CAMPEP_0197866004 /NCGR_PEP_ID=MMETSP1438-20131217/43975_1 /TAXON_ID=1461541 /ORGANISM="Pterosperma sp., Strain CCMP1384" /LENGTH=544 /DNA_ID=CAMNT_0043484533 /DNA_START=266 /DNA_END=1900 /DNA_ORIENTATION=+
MAGRRSFEVTRRQPDERTSLDSKRQSIVVTHDTEIVQAVNRHQNTKKHEYDLQKLIQRAQTVEEHAEDVTTYDHLLREKLSKAIFVGHMNTDLDSVAGAIGAAALFGGTPAISEPAESLNGEILYALKNAGIETPQLFDKIPNSATCDVVLVDHTEEKQMVPSIRDSPNRASRIIGVLDHHALAKSFYTSKPIFMDLRPWGSVSTIIAVLFISHKRCLPRPIAVLLLQAILSDTLNLRSVTTTEADRGMVALLSTYGQIKTSDIDLLAKKQFQAKTNWVVSLGAYEMVRGDQKDFSCGDWKIGISVLEVTDTTRVLEVSHAILMELRLLKKEKGLVSTDDSQEGSEPAMQLQKSKELDFAFLFVVNIVEERSILLIPGGRELALAKAAFMDPDETKEVHLMAASAGISAPGSTIKADETAMQLAKGHVSRKAQFVPEIFAAIEANFTYEAKGPTSLSNDKSSDVDTQRVLDALEKSKAEGKEATTSEGGEGSTKILEEEEDVAMLKEELQYLNTGNGGNLYDDQGRVCRRSSVMFMQRSTTATF